MAYHNLNRVLFAGILFLFMNLGGICMAAQPPESEPMNPFQQAHAAVMAGDVRTAERLFAEHPDVLADPDGGWLMTATSETDSVEMVKLLMRLGFKLNSGKKGLPTPLWGAICNNRNAMAIWLLDNGADPNEYNVLGTAAREGNLKLVKVLLERGADLHACWGPGGKSFNALIMAEAYGHKEVATYLREQGAVQPGQPVPKKPPAKKGEQPESKSPIRPAELRDEVIAHLTKHLGKVEPISQIQIVPDTVAISIHIARPTKERPNITLFTTGMSEKPMAVPKGETEFRFAELMMHLPPDWPITEAALKNSKNSWPFHWLRQIANYPHKHDTWLGGRYTIISNDDPPKPLAPDLPFTCLLCASRMNDYSQLKTSDGKKIEFYTVTPIFTEERDLEKRSGIFALFRAFDGKGVGQVVDLHRVNVAR